MPSAHGIQALNFKLLLRLVGRYSPVKFISCIVAWVRGLWRWAFYGHWASCAIRSSTLSGGEPGEGLNHDDGRSRDCAPQPHDHAEPSALAHDIDDHDENQPGEQTPSMEAAETVNTTNPGPPLGPTPTISPSSFPSYPSSALSPTAPELLVQRYHRGGTMYVLNGYTAHTRLISFRMKTDVKVILEPHTRSFTRYAGVTPL
jgi:hypothetical protein